MASSEIIAIGSELLLGETQDTNTAFLLRKLREIGVDIYRTQIIGDNVQRIANAIHESLSRVDIVITTGGLGPTIDDPTREAVAKAFDEDLVYHEALWDEIKVYFTNHDRQPTENNRRQAYLPASAQVIHNEIGTWRTRRKSMASTAAISATHFTRSQFTPWNRKIGRAHV